MEWPLGLLESIYLILADVSLTETRMQGRILN